MSRLWGRFKLWLLSAAWAWFLVLASSLALRKRMSHNNGVSARGRLRLNAKLDIPQHPFFKPGTEWPCRVRHSSVSYDDDTVIQVRAASLKLADASWESPLDLEFNTGRISLFWSAANFAEFFLSKSRVDGIPCDFVKFYRKYPRGLVAALDGIRDNPESFSGMRYHSQVAQRFVGTDGKLRYAMYRLLPENDGPETGVVESIPSTAQYAPFWSEDRRPGETRSSNYLKDEFRERLNRTPIRYKLQIQLREPAVAGAADPVASEDPEVFNCNKTWDEEKYPYVDLGVVELTECLTYEENQLMRFALKNTPPSLGNLPSWSASDYNSVVYMRNKSSPAKAARILAYKLFGIPKPLPAVGGSGGSEGPGSAGSAGGTEGGSRPQ